MAIQVSTISSLIYTEKKTPSDLRRQKRRKEEFLRKKKERNNKTVSSVQNRDNVDIIPGEKDQPINVLALNLK